MLLDYPSFADYSLPNDIMVVKSKIKTNEYEQLIDLMTIILQIVLNGFLTTE